VVEVEREGWLVISEGEKGKGRAKGPQETLKATVLYTQSEGASRLSRGQRGTRMSTTRRFTESHRLRASVDRRK